MQLPTDALSQRYLTCRILPTYYLSVSAPDLFTALANPLRRKILEILLKEPATANEIAGRFKQHRPAVSEHLQVLRKARLVRCEARGRERHYFLEPARLMPVSAWLEPFEQYWRSRIKKLEQVLDEQEKRRD